MLPGTLRPYYLLLLITGLSWFMQSCSKGTNYVVKVPAADTTAMLIGAEWKVNKLWLDMNNNGLIDSGEMVNGFDFIHVYIFSPNGALRDSTVPYLTQAGTWSFSGGYKSSIYFTLGQVSNIYNIMGITDTTLVAKLNGTDQTWYFTKYGSE